MASEKIIHYGICGEGLGHLARAEFLVPILMEAGYRVVVHASGRAARLAPSRLPGCEHVAVRGLHFHYRDNGVDLARSALNYAAIGWWWTPETVPRIWRNWTRPPAGIVTDYEPILARCRMAAGIPHVAFDHQQVATIAADVPARVGRLGLATLRGLTSMVVGRPTLRVVTSFFEPRRRRRWAEDPRLHVVGPILREEVRARRPTAGDHVVVYQTSDSLGWLGELLERLPGEKRVYGGRAPEAGRAGNGRVTWRAPDTATFLDDLASCRFVVVNGGYTVICEALHFGKPVLCLPIRRQVEQELNAAWVEELGFGRSHWLGRGEIPDLTSFVARLDDFRAAIAARALVPGNEAARRLVLDHFAAAAAGEAVS